MWWPLTAPPDCPCVFVSLRKGDGVMFVWRLSPELQQSMHDRMCELRPEGATTGSVGVNTSSDCGRGATSTSRGGCDSDGRPSDVVEAKVSYLVGLVVVLMVRFRLQARARSRGDLMSKLIAAFV